MTSQQEQHLVKMAAQIAANLSAGVDAETAAVRTADHMKRFWTPEMRARLLACSQDAITDIDATVLAALTLLSAQRTA